MGFRRSIQPVNRVKHVVDVSGGLTSTTSTVDFAVVVAQRSIPMGANECLLASTINGLFLSIYIIGSTGAPLSGPLDWYIHKRRAGQASASFPVPGNTGVSDLRNQIFHEEKGLSGSGDGTPMVFKGVIAIPKGMRRMRQGDILSIKLVATGADTPNFCIKAIYNEYS